MCIRDRFYHKQVVQSLVQSRVSPIPGTSCRNHPTQGNKLFSMLHSIGIVCTSPPLPFSLHSTCFQTNQQQNLLKAHCYQLIACPPTSSPASKRSIFCY